MTVKTARKKHVTLIGVPTFLKLTIFYSVGSSIILLCLKGAFQHFMNRLKKIVDPGYNITHAVLRSDDFLVPQKRVTLNLLNRCSFNPDVSTYVHHQHSLIIVIISKARDSTSWGSAKMLLRLVRSLSFHALWKHTQLGWVSSWGEPETRDIPKAFRLVCRRGSWTTQTEQTFWSTWIHFAQQLQQHT